MSASEETIIDFLKSKAEGAWKEELPYLLSFAVPDMIGAGIDYQAVLNGEKLKAFVERTEGAGRYRVVKHPHQKAKIGLVQHDVDYQFKVEVEEEKDARQYKGATSLHGSALLNFLDALSKLATEDLEGVVIPTQVLVKLAKQR